MNGWHDVAWVQKRGGARAGRLGVFLTLTSMVFAANGLAQDQTYVRELSGIFYSQLDNPYVSGGMPQAHVNLSSGQDASYSRDEQNGIDQSATFCFEIVAGAFPFPPEAANDFYNQGWSSGPGQRSDRTTLMFEGEYSSGDTIFFENRDVYLGHNFMSFAWRIHSSDANTIPPDPTPQFPPAGWLPETQTWRLEGDTIIVPVTIVVAHPPGEDPWISEADARALVDSYWTISSERSASPGGEINQRVVTAIRPSMGLSDGSRRVRDVKGLYNVDDVFSQCGIQFRLESYVAVEVPNVIYYNNVGIFPETEGCLLTLSGSGNSKCVRPFTFADPKTCGGSPDSDDRLNGVKVILELARAKTRTNKLTGLVETGPFTSLPLVLTGQFGDDELLTSCGQSAKAAGLTNPGFAGAMNFPSAVAAVARNFVFNNNNTLAHEIGHVLLNSNAHSEYYLMKEGDGNSTRIPGCASWGHTFPGVPYGCLDEPVAHTDTQCSAMRFGAAEFGSSPGSIGPAPPNLRPLPYQIGIKPAGFGGQWWTYGHPQSTSVIGAPFDDQLATEGEASLIIPVGYTDIVSPRFLTADVREVGDKMSLDVYIPAQVANPWWVGSMALSVDVPSAGIYNQWLSQVELTTLPLGQWSTVEFSLPLNVMAALHSDLPGARFAISSNVSTAGLRVDGLRMSGNLQPQTSVHMAGSPPDGVALLPHGAFDDLASWSSAAPLELETQRVIEGNGSLRLNGLQGYTLLQSDTFSTDDIVGLTSEISLDVYISDPQPNPWWVGDIHLYASCPSANLNNYWLGSEGLTNLFMGEFNQLVFSVPSEVLDVWEGSYHDCSLSLAVNVNAGSGVIQLDRLGFLETP